MDTPGSPPPAPPPPALWAVVLDASSDLLALLDERGRIVWINATFSRVSGHSADAAAGRFLPELMADGGPWRPVEAALRQGRGFDAVELTWRHPTGGRRSARLSARRLQDDEGGSAAHRVLLTMQDVDAQRADLEIAVELGKVAIWRHDLALDRVFYNEVAQRVLSLPAGADSLSLTEVRSLIHPDDLPRVEAAAKESLTSERPVDIEARYRHAGGGWIYVLTRRMLRRDKLGQPMEFIGIALDVTDQVEKLRQAAELTNRLESAAAAAGVGIWSFDTLNRKTEWNPSMYMITGRRPDQPVLSSEQWINEVVYPDDRAMLQQARATLMASDNVSLENQYRIVRPDGEVRWLVNRSRHERRDGRSILFGMAFDITDRVLAEAELNSANERVALAARSVGLGCWEWNVETGSMAWDAAMFRMRNLEPRDQAPSEAERLAITHPDDAERVRAMAHQAAATTSSASYEFRVIWPDGSVRWLASRCTPVTDVDGKTRRLIGVNWDITEAKSLQISRHEHELAQRESKAKSEFLSRMSHELRTPLNAVLGFAQLLLLDSPGLSTAQRGKLGHIQSAGEHLLSLINDVLDLSSLESGQLRLDLQAVKLQDVLLEALPLVEAMARAQDVSLHAEPLTGVVYADRMRVRQVLINLLSNGIKYTPAGGRVTVSCDGSATQVRLRVQDNGRGMSATQLAHLFEPFNRLGVESQGIEGSGIGLALVKVMVEGMHGSISVTSRPQAGSTFDVLLPRWNASPDHAVTSAAQAPAAEPPARDPPARSGSLLYIEDNPINVILVEQLVRSRAGLTITSEATGQSGVARARELRPDLILVDIQLPDIDGLEVLRRLRLQPETAHTPCIALSANAMPEDISRALSAGFFDYWTKPIAFAPFLATLDRLFPNGSATRPGTPE